MLSLLEKEVSIWQNYTCFYLFKPDSTDLLLFVFLKMKAREIIKIIEQDGWFLVRQKGSHRQYKHPTKKGLVTIAAHKMNDEIAFGTLNSIYKQAQIDKQ